MKEHSLDFAALIEKEAKSINLQFERSSLEGKNCSQDIADRRERAVQQFLKKYFPFPYRVTKGSIIDTFGNRSNSIDCVLLNPLHPNTISDDDYATIILADGVDLVIEVKPKLIGKEIERSLKQGESVKKLKKIHYKDYGSPLINAKDEKKYWESIRQIPYVVFCESTYKSPEKLLNTLSNYYLDNNIGREGQFDIIVILNEYIVVNVGNGGIIYFEEFDQNGFYIMDSKEKTLLSFLFTLNLLPCFSSKDLTHPIITDYVPPMQFALKEDRLINHKLRELNNQVPDFEKRD